MEMDAQEIDARVRQVIAAQLEIPAEQVRGPARFREDLQADSLALVEVALSLEEAFHLTIPEADTDGLRTVQDAIDYVRARVG
jgi:acyl carrier protein